MVMNRKGFLRIVEATIAVLIILSAFIVIASQKEATVTRDLSYRLPPFLDEVAEDQDFRIRIIQNPNDANLLGEIENQISNGLDNSALDLKVKICELKEQCPIDDWPGDFEVFSAERVVSAALDGSAYDAKKLKLFVWRKI
jgi:hypothetical protein